MRWVIAIPRARKAAMGTAIVTSVAPNMQHAVVLDYGLQT